MFQERHRTSVIIVGCLDGFDYIAKTSTLSDLSVLFTQNKPKTSMSGPWNYILSQNKKREKEKKKLNTWLDGWLKLGEKKDNIGTDGWMDL